MADHCFINDLFGKEASSLKKDCIEFRQKKLWKKCPGCCNITEIMLKTVLKTIQSTISTTDLYTGLCKLRYDGKEWYR